MNTLSLDFPLLYQELLFSIRFLCGPRTSPALPMPPSDSLLNLWRISRPDVPRDGRSYSLGVQRPLNKETISLAAKMVQLSAPQMSAIFWRLHPWRALLTVAFGFLRGLLPAFKGYSHALIIDEVSTTCLCAPFEWFAYDVHGMGVRSKRSSHPRTSP